MNAIRSFVHLSIRGYRTGRGNSSLRQSRDANRPRRIEMLQPGMPIDMQDNEVDDVINPEDVDAHESNFSNAAEYHRMHDRELEIAKDKLKTQIVKRKYFKTNEPAMLTWGEKEQIRLLHKEDPEEWDADKLHESFPASREAILKIIRSNWQPKSVDTVEKYEKTVKKNWQQFKAGKLEVSVELKEHLAKFKNRKIVPMDEETIKKKILKEKPVFPEPKSKVFSNIVRGYAERIEKQKREEEDDDLIPKQIENKEAKEVPLTKKENSEKLLTQHRVYNQHRTFDQFLETHPMSTKKEKTKMINRVLFEEMKDKSAESYARDTLFTNRESEFEDIENKETEKKDKSESQESRKTLVLRSGSAVGDFESEENHKKIRFENENTENSVRGSQGPVAVWKKTEVGEGNEAENLEQLRTGWEDETEREANALITETKWQSRSLDPDRERREYLLSLKLEGNIDTGIIERHKTGATVSNNYVDYIKIPKNKYKPGATFRVQDCYYDDDGEFLYRVPGLKT